MIQIRTAVIEDKIKIASIYEEQFSRMAELQPYFWQNGEPSAGFIANTIEDKESDIVIAEDEGRIVGFILIQEKESSEFSFKVYHKYAYLMDIIVTKDQRGKGIGTLLLNYAKQWSAERQLDYIQLSVLANNENALSLYEKNGFTNMSTEMTFVL